MDDFCECKTCARREGIRMPKTEQEARNLYHTTGWSFWKTPEGGYVPMCPKCTDERIDGLCKHIRGRIEKDQRHYPFLQPWGKEP